MIKQQFRVLKLFIIVFIMALGFSQISIGENVATISELEGILRDNLDQIEVDYQKAQQDLINARSRELQIIEASHMPEVDKQKLKIKVEKKYLSIQSQLLNDYTTRKTNTVQHYESIKKEIMHSRGIGAIDGLRNQRMVFVAPQELIDNWQIVTNYRFIGTLKFSNVRGVVVATIYFLRYNKWDDIKNLTYDGCNIAFDYENPYGVSLHFEGVINQKGTELKGRFVDLKTHEIYKWKAYR